MYIFLIIIGIISVPFIVALFTSTTFTIKEFVLIDAPRQEVFDYIKLLRNQEQYSKWVMTDPNMKKGFQGVDGTVGFVYAWDSENKQAGKGSQEIITLEDGVSIGCEIRFIKPFESKAGTLMTTIPVNDDQTRVTWAFSGICNYPMRVVHLLFNLKKVLAKDMATSLALLKSNLEKAEIIN